VSDIPPTRYATTVDGFHLAWQVVGQGPPDLLYMPHWATHVEVMWEDPPLSSFIRRLAVFSRTILFDKRGTGLSDPVSIPHLPTLDAWMEDIDAVLDAAGAQRAVLFASDASAVLPILYAATRPERTSALIVVNGTARVRRDVDYRIGIPEHLSIRWVEQSISEWGQDSTAYADMDPSVAGDPDYRAWANRYQRATASPGAIAPMFHLLHEADVRSVLPAIAVPTLVLHRVDDPFIRADHGRYLAAHIPDAEFVELPGVDHAPELGDATSVIREIRRFLTGEAAVPPAARVLACVVFTDLVDSTTGAARLGDEEWGDLLDRHNQVVRRQLARYRGREVRTTGDGFLATFDGPARAIQCACAIRDAVRSLGLSVRCGVHAGEIDITGDDISGIAVHIAARVMAHAPADDVLVSSAVKDLVVGSGIQFSDRGEHELKGVPGTWRLFTVEG
jgi:class 3 adenylate cyclase